MPSQVRRRSVTRGNIQDARYAPIVNFLLPSTDPQDELPQYWSKARDVYLRRSVYRESTWASAIHIAITKMSSLNWDVEGDAPRLRQQAHRLLLEADEGGWTKFISRHLRDFLTTDNGAFVEVVRGSGARGARILGLMHLDSWRCTRTGDPDVPILYRDILGVEHELKDYQVLALADMPDAADNFYNVGFCAASRAWKPILKLSAVERYYYEKVSGNRPLALDLVGGVTQQKITDAFQSAQDQQKAKGAVAFMGAILLPTLGEDVEASHVRIDFASLPDHFDREKEFNIATLQYANAIGLDPQDLQPLTGRPLGSGEQSLTLHEKAETRGLMAWRQELTHQLNEFVVADTVLFSFTSKDLQTKKREADIDKDRIEAAGTLVEKGVITSAQAAEWLSDHDVIPKEFVPVESTQDTSLSDEEKPDMEEGVEGEPLEPSPEELMLETKEADEAIKLFEELIPEADDEMKQSLRQVMLKPKVRYRKKETGTPNIVVNVPVPNVIVNIPEQPPPNIIVNPQMGKPPDVIVNVPHQAPPEVTVNVPPPGAPIVTVRNTITMKKIRSLSKMIRGALGQIDEIETTEEVVGE